MDAIPMVYRCGSFGEGVRKIQEALAVHSFYDGPIDGIYGGATETAVRTFQAWHKLTEDGIVGPGTWAALLGGLTPVIEDDPATKSIQWRCMALTGSFETGSPPPSCFSAIAGNFDGQGLSFGALQWNLGQGTLQPLLKDLMDRLGDIFHDRASAIERALQDGKDATMEWALSIQTSRHQVMEPWLGMFRDLGRTFESQKVQIAHAEKYFINANLMSHRLGVISERAFALLFDIAVQCGGVRPVVLKQLETEFPKLSEEIDKLRLIANRCAEASNPRWMEDVRMRKLTIANGAGVVHGRHYDLEAQYGIRLSVRGIE